MNTGTPRELKPIAEEVLKLVAQERKLIAEKYFQGSSLTTRILREARLADLRRIELCAEVTMNVANFVELYDLQTQEQSLETYWSKLADAERMQDDNLEEPRGSFD